MQIYLFSYVAADVQHYYLWNPFSKLCIIYKWKMTEFTVSLLSQLFGIWEL